jgi:predicted lipoprotein with Yx(FWY)xxD motif
MTFPVLGARARMLSMAAIAMIVVGACSSAATPAPATAAPATAAPATAAPATAAPATAAPATSAPATAAPASPSAAASEVTLKVVTGAGSLGKYMTGDGDKTLYIFTNDKAGDGKSTCYDACATNWPALVVPAGAKVSAGTDATGEFATITRTDGKLQATYKGMPLYYFAADAAAGDTKGQGQGNGKWFVAAP